MADQIVESCRFCETDRSAGPVCVSCGGIDRPVPLAEFLSLEEVDRERLESVAARLRSLGEDDDTLRLRACLELSLKSVEGALPLLRRLTRAHPEDEAVASLYREVDHHHRTDALARAVLDRERGELGDRRIVLVADGSETVRRSLEIALKLHGHVVVPVEDADQALEMMCDIRPDIVFVDFQLPGIDGFDLCRRLRDEARTHRVPVVILSSNAWEGLQKRAAKEGADAFLKKPTTQEILLETLAELT